MKINPILMKDLKVRARSVHIPIFVMIYNAVLAFIGIFMLISSVDVLNTGGQVDYGKMNDMFLFIGIFQFIMILFVTLSVSATGFAGEKERGTLDLLLMTPISTLELVNGKLLSSVLTGMLFAFSSLPILLLGTVYGGTDLTDVIFLMMILVLLAFSTSSRASFWSILFDKSSVAVVLALITEIVFLTGPFVLLEFVEAFIYNGYQYNMTLWPTAACLSFQFLNPLSLISVFYGQIQGMENVVDFYVYFYGIRENSSLHLWLQQNLVTACAVGQVAFTAVVHLINVRLLKKGRNII